MMLHRALIGAAAVSLTLGITVRAQAPTTSTGTRTTRPPAVSAQVAAQQREVFLKACARCHPPEFVTQTRRTKDQWEESINQMVTARGAVLTPEEYSTVLAYLVREWGPASAAGTRRAGTPTTSIAVTPGGTRAPAAGASASGAGGTSTAGAQPTRGATGGAGAPASANAAAVPPPAPRPRGGAGPDDKHIVDSAAAMRGRKTYASACIQCHGTQARGGQGGSNVLRSSTLLHDRYGNLIGPFLRKGHPVQGGPPASSYTEQQMVDLSHFLRERFNDTLRGSPVFTVQNVLTGNRAAGEAYFNGDGGCRECHSAAGDLKGIGGRFDPPALQQRFLFPRPPTRGPRAPAGGPGGAVAGKPTTVTVTAASGESVTGVLVSLDDFTVALRDPNGAYRSWKRTADLTVVKNDPYAAHVALLDRYTDKNMHDIVAYLESLK